jgi:hypothetical protein
VPPSCHQSISYFGALQLVASIARVLAGDDPESVMFDFVHPFAAGRRKGVRWKARRNEARGQDLRTRRHAGHIATAARESRVRAAFHRRNCAAAIMIPMKAVNVQENSRRSIASPARNEPRIVACGEHCAGLVQAGGAGIFERSRFHAPYIFNSERGGRKSAR